MKWLWFLGAFALVVLAAAGVYNVNYDAQESLDELDRLRKQLAEEREAVQVLRVEWAYLNAPHRLQALVAAHHEDLGLVRLTHQHYGVAGSVPFPPQTPFDQRASAALSALEAPPDAPAGAEPLPVPMPPDRPLSQVAAWRTE